MNASNIKGKPLKTLHAVYLARHGETAWSLSGQHTGLTDLPLTRRGECNAHRLEERLKGLEFARVFTSPLKRAKRTCEIAGFGSRAELDCDLVESVGRRTRQVLAKRIIAELENKDEPELRHDSSTNNLIRRYRQLKENA